MQFLDLVVNLLGWWCLTVQGPLNSCVFTLYRAVKWVKHRVQGQSHIQTLCEDVTDTIGGAMWNLYVQFLLSKKLQGPLEDWQDMDETATSVCSIKKVDTNKQVYRKIQLALAIQKGIVTERRRIQELANEEAKWTDLVEKDFQKSIKSLEDTVPLDLDEGESHKKSKMGINWVSLGFQGADPCTDFRGTGRFGIECFHWLCLHHPEVAVMMIQESGSREGLTDKPWYSFGLVSIHMSRLVIDEVAKQGSALFVRWMIRSMDSDRATKHLLGQGKDIEQDMEREIEHRVYELHSRLMMEFHTFWLVAVRTKKVKSVLDTEQCLDNFRQWVLKGYGKA